mgnify:CR=1 FL=1
MPTIHPVYAAMDRTIFDVMSGRARELGAINLGQGFPDGSGPVELIEAAARALREKSNQYPPSAGLPELRDAICGYYRRGQGLELAREQVVVTSGATEAIADAVLALVHPGDEVILFQPAYDAYAPMLRRAGGGPVPLPLSPPDWCYPLEAMAAAITPRTRVVMLNDPLNPAGSVASHAELAWLAELCVAHDLTVISDEVWEDVRFDGHPHRSILTFPGMADRCVNIGSAGKIFGVTGWKIGWMIAAPSLTPLLARGHIVPGEDDHHGDTTVAATGGSEQFMHVTGTLTLHGERYAIDSHYPRDRSWGQVREERRGGPRPMPPVGWSPMYFGEDLIFNQISVEHPDTDPAWADAFEFPAGAPTHHFAWVVENGVTKEIVRVHRQAHEYHPTLDVVTRQTVEAEAADGTVYRFTGEAIAAANVPAWPNASFRDTVYRWDDGRGRVTHSTYQELWYDKYQNVMNNRRRAVTSAGR